MIKPHHLFIMELPQVAQLLIHTHFFLHCNILWFCLLSSINNCISIKILHHPSATAITHNLLLPPVIIITTTLNKASLTEVKNTYSHTGGSSRAMLHTQVDTNVHTDPQVNPATKETWHPQYNTKYSGNDYTVVSIKISCKI